ncbi:hypothetical protein LINPERPRIM_LOCUS13105, partial [Linum perenne]
RLCLSRYSADPLSLSHTPPVSSHSAGVCLIQSGGQHRRPAAKLLHPSSSSLIQMDTSTGGDGSSNKNSSSTASTKGVGVKQKTDGYKYRWRWILDISLTIPLFFRCRVSISNFSKYCVVVCIIGVI